MGHTFGYHYDKARRLVGLTNENGARYRFAYDVLDRLIAESGFDHKLTGYRYNAGNELVEQREFGDDATLAAKLMAQLGGQPVPKKDVSPLSDDLDSQTPLRITEFKRDILGRLIHTLARDNDKVQETVYGYDRTGNLTHSTDQRTGTTRFEYDKLGRITKAGNELFAFDPAHNILDIPTEKVKPYPTPSPVGEGRGEGKTAALLSANSNAITDNRLKTYNGTTYYYDELSNLIHRELADGEMQNYFYDLHDQLVKAEIFKKDGTKETWSYTYDALGRRIGKGRLKNEEVSNDLENQTRFVWDGSHLLQEIHPDGRYTYIYTDPDSYEPLAQVRNRTTEDGESKQEINYFHCDQIGIPREMTDKDGNLLWFGNYTGWGRLKEETKVKDNAYQPFRLQNQYADRETGLHYNFFRYYEPDAGRFVNQDLIKLSGGDNLYQFALNIQGWVDPWGWECQDGIKKIDDKLKSLDKTTEGKTSGIYVFLTSKFSKSKSKVAVDGKLPYVGQSVDIRRRLLEHFRDGKFNPCEDIDSLEITKCNHADLNKTEAEKIWGKGGRANTANIRRPPNTGRIADTGQFSG